MSNNNEIEQQLEKYFLQIKERMYKVAEEAIGEVYCHLLPYVTEDALANAQHQAEDIVRQIASGNFKFEGDYAVIEGVREFSPRVRIAMTANKYNAVRDALIERMPKCPKDDKIQALENELKLAYESRY